MIPNAPDTPKRPGLPSVASETNGNDPSRTERDAESTADRVDRYFWELHGMVKAIATTQETQRGDLSRVRADLDLTRIEQRRLADGLALLSARTEHRAPMPSFTSILDDADEVITKNGTHRLAYSEEQLLARVRAEYLKLQGEAQQARDAAPVAFVRSEVVPKFWIGVAGAMAVTVVGGLVALVRWLWAHVQW